MEQQRTGSSALTGQAQKYLLDTLSCRLGDMDKDAFIFMGQHEKESSIEESMFSVASDVELTRVIGGQLAPIKLYFFTYSS